MKKLSNLFLGFVTFVFVAVVGLVLCYFTIPNFKSYVDNLINPPITETYDLTVNAENSIIKVMQGDKVIEPGAKVLTAGKVYKITTAGVGDNYVSNNFYLNGKLYQSGAEIVCDSNFDISSVVVGTYDLVINYINCEGLELRDITNAPNETTPGVEYIGYEILPGEKVLYEGQVLMVHALPIYENKEFVQCTVVSGTSTLIYTYEDSVLGLTHNVKTHVEITLEYADIEEEPVALPASYFTFDDGALTGFSAEGQAAYDAGEVTELVLPSSYSLGELVTEEVTYTEFHDLDMYCMENGYNFTFVNSADESISITSEEDFFDNYEELMMLWEENQSITVTMQSHKFVDGDDFVITKLGSSCFSGCTSLVSIIIPESVLFLDSYCFSGCGFREIIIPESVTALGVGTFNVCRNLTSIVLPTSITRLPGSCFEGCSALVDIILSDTLLYIEGYVFAGTALKSIVIPSSVLSFYNYVFRFCPNLTVWDFSKAVSIPVISPLTFDFGSSEFQKDDFNMIVPDSLYDEWIVAENWSNYADHIVKASEYVA